MTIVGTRPELIKLSRVIAELDRHTRHTLVHTGQNFDYELNGIFFRDLEIRQPDHFLRVAEPTAAETIGKVIVKADEVLARAAAGRRRDLRRHEQLPRRDRRQTPPDPDLSHGGRQPLLRPARAGGDQPQDHRPHQRHQPAADRAGARLPARRRPAAGDGDQDRLDDARGARVLPAGHRGVGRARPAGTHAERVLRRQRPPRGERRRSGAARGCCSTG